MSSSDNANPTDPTRPGRALVLPANMEELFGKFASMLAKYLRENYKADTPVHHYEGPSTLAEKFGIELPDGEGTGYDSLVEVFEKCMHYGMRTGHIRFYNQLWAGSDVAAVVSEWFLSVLNTSMYTYEVAPVFTLMEMHCVDKFVEMIGFDKTKAEGTFAPGGAHSNMLGILAARHATFPDMKHEGIPKDVFPVAFTSLHSHYTVKRTVSVMGMGLNACKYVPVDEQGMMIPEKLDEMITQAKAEGKTPFLVNATCGTTVYGAYDNLDAIADVCEKHKVWLHVDACWGGHCLFSKTHKSLMKGVHRADSVAVTGTKCLGLPQQCSAVILKKAGLLRSCNAMGADYLFHEYEEKNYDVGDLTLNCGRRVDAFKLWCAWKVHGGEGLEMRVDHAFALGKYVTDKVKQSGGVFEMAHDPQSLNICFWYVPPQWRGKSRSEERDKVLDVITEKIRRVLQLEGKILTNFADVPGQPHFFRHIVCNPGANYEDQDFLLAEMHRIGDEISKSL